MARSIERVLKDLSKAGYEDIPELNIRGLANALAPDEAITGAMGDSSDGMYGLMVLTPLRIILVTGKTSWLGREECHVSGIFWGDATSADGHIERNNRHIWGRYFKAIGYSGQQLFCRFPHVEKGGFQRFLQTVNESIVRNRLKTSSSQQQTGSQSQTNETAAQSSFLDQLERLGRLRRQGLLTDDEFQVAKRKLLS